MKTAKKASAEITDAHRLDYLERRAKMSKTGVTFEWYGDKDHTGYRWMSRQHLGDPFRTVREAIDFEIKQELVK